MVLVVDHMLVAPPWNIEITTLLLSFSWEEATILLTTLKKVVNHHRDGEYRRQTVVRYRWHLGHQFRRYPNERCYVSLDTANR